MSTSEREPTAPHTPPRRTRSTKAKQSVPVSVFLGIMLVPLAAAASMFLVTPAVEESTAAEPIPPNDSEVGAVPDLERDILAACGPIGLEMTELEKAGSLTQLQRAALDALRPICAQQGSALPEASSVQTVPAVLNASNSVGAGSSSKASDDHPDNDWDDSLDSDDWDDSFDSDDWDDG